MVEDPVWPFASRTVTLSGPSECSTPEILFQSHSLGLGLRLAEVENHPRDREVAALCLGRCRFTYCFGSLELQGLLDKPWNILECTSYQHGALGADTGADTQHLGQA